MASVSSIATASASRAGAFQASCALAPRHRHALIARVQSEYVDLTAEETTTTTAPTTSTFSSPHTPAAAAAPTARAKAAGPRLWDALAFGGPAPERTNGRLAMVGFVSALAVEATRGDGILSQADNGAGLAWFAYTAAVLSAASLVPLLQGESAEGRSGRFMTADAELWNGRLAMLGLVALAVTEYLTGAPFVNV